MLKNSNGKLYRKSILYLLSVFFIMLFLSGCALFPKEEEVITPPVVKPKPPAYNLYTVKKGEIIKAVLGMATFSSAKEYSLFYKIDGRLKELNVQTGDQVKKGQILAKLDAEELEETIRQQNFALEKTKLTISYLKKMKDKILAQNKYADVGEQQYQIEMNGIDQKSIQYQLSKLQSRLNNTILMAPIDGKVVFVEELNEGDNIQPYQKIIRIADPDRLQLVMQYKPDGQTPIFLGMKADVEINKKIYQGEVIATPADLPNETDDRYKNILILSIKDQPKDVKVGDMVSVSIITEKKDNVIIIPKQAVREYMGRTYVQILEGNTKKEVDIDIGIQNATEVEVSKGLRENQKIILR